MGYSIYKINFDKGTYVILYSGIETIEKADLLAQLAMSSKNCIDELIFICAGWNREIKNDLNLYNKSLQLAEEYKVDYEIKFI